MLITSRIVPILSMGYFEFFIKGANMSAIILALNLIPSRFLSLAPVTDTRVSKSSAKGLCKLTRARLDISRGVLCFSDLVLKRRVISFLRCFTSPFGNVITFYSSN